MKWIKRLVSMISRKSRQPRWPPGVPELTIEELHQSRERGLQMRLRHPMFAIMADDLAQVFAEAGASNYVEYTSCSEKYGPMSVRIQRLEGETPAMQNEKLRKRIAELEENVKEQNKTDKSHGSALVVCLCGSSRFPELHHRVMMEETLNGNIVIPMGLYGHADYPHGARKVTNDGDESNAVKKMLDKLHYQKIDLSDEVIVVSEDGYCGNSTHREIDYAISRGKRVRYWQNNRDGKRELKLRRDGYQFCEEHQQEFLEYCCGCALNLPASERGLK